MIECAGQWVFEAWAIYRNGLLAGHEDTGPPDWAVQGASSAARHCADNGIATSSSVIAVVGGPKNSWDKKPAEIGGRT